ncbi:hypothetical protein ABK730_09995 [Klebsiella indica]|uniref:hypothetical protein n=1 Tax=Klebsiella indica TaxID=2582917 RepID=UPI0031B7042D
MSDGTDRSRLNSTAGRRAKQVKKQRRISRMIKIVSERREAIDGSHGYRYVIPLHNTIA